MLKNKKSSKPPPVFTKPTNYEYQLSTEGDSGTLDAKWGLDLYTRFCFT